MAIIVRCTNSIVTDPYLETIGYALSANGHSVAYTTDVTDVYKKEKNEIVVVACRSDACNLLFRGYKNVVMWFQGVEPEESYMRHQSRMRWMILSIFEKYIIRKAKFIMFVSEAMKEHYTNKYHVTFPAERCYCMPCSNSTLHPETFFIPNKYKNNVFSYVGSLEVWQKFEETIICYKSLEKLNLPNLTLKILTFDKAKAIDFLEKNEIRNYSVDYVDNDKISDALADVKFGFIIRDDCVVNRVSTPTKISTYLSCGVIPIYSSCIQDFSAIAKDLKYAVSFDDSFEKNIIDLSKQCIDPNLIFKEYNAVFQRYYNHEFHCKNIGELFKKVKWNG